MTKTIGEVIDEYRENNHYSVKRLTENIISYAAYYRFVHDNASISTVRFLALLERLDVSIDEINASMDNDYISSNQFISSYLHICTGDRFNDAGLKVLHDLVRKRYEATKSTRCLHYLWITQCSLDRWHQTTARYQEDILNFFNSRVKWSEANLVLFALISTSLPFLFISRSFEKISKQFIQNLSSRQVEEAFFRFLINTCLQCINHQSLFLFKKASDQLAHLVSVNGSLSISVYRQFIIDLALWEQNPSRFTQAHFITAANLLKSLHQGLLANQLLTYTDAFEESVINNHSRIISKPFILVL